MLQEVVQAYEMGHRLIPVVTLRPRAASDVIEAVLAQHGR